MKQRVLPGVLAVMVLTASCAHGQQTVAPPPKGTAAASDLAVTMKNLEEKLRSIGPVVATATYHNKQPEQKWSFHWSEDLTRSAADPKNCVLKIPWQDGVVDYYLEEVSNVDVLSLPDYMLRVDSVVEANSDPPLFLVSGSEWGTFFVIFPTREAAEQVASLLGQAVKQCTERVTAPLQPGGAEPTFSETLTFIGEKLRSQGKVTVSSDKGWYAVDYSASPGPTPCTMSLHNSWSVIVGRGQDYLLSFRRIERIEVMPWTEAKARQDERDGHPKTQYNVSRVTYVLRITTPDGHWRDLDFADETLADRVAKAMVHGAELCGAGTKREPF